MGVAAPVLAGSAAPAPASDFARLSDTPRPLPICGNRQAGSVSVMMAKSSLSRSMPPAHWQPSFR